MAIAIVPGLIIIIIFLTGIILLQIFLSKRENKWLGLILPAISFIFSLITILGIALFTFESPIQIIMQLMVMFLLLNIPTAILVAIYFACREKFKKSKEMDKMNIQDLE